jgi:hypothetical protein
MVVENEIADMMLRRNPSPPPKEGGRNTNSLSRKVMSKALSSVDSIKTEETTSEDLNVQPKQDHILELIFEVQISTVFEKVSDKLILCKILRNTQPDDLDLLVNIEKMNDVVDNE